ncbi:cell division protein FtsX [Altererythrobacter sp.]|uniref:cell division protein FtsX n=1 Tax=Altererythrobacter sp. TaxID=1872480 RepID=UPI003D020561
MKKPPQIGRSLFRDLPRLSGRRSASLVPQRRIAGPVSWVIAIMIALIVIAAAGGLGLNNLADRARADLSGAVTVQIAEANAELREKQSRAVAAELVQDPAVASLRAVPQEELGALLEPWLGSLDAEGAVPVPALIDVELRREADEAEVARLQALVEKTAPGARVDAQSSWLKPVYSALSALQYLALVLIALLSVTGAAAVWLAARSAFTNHHETVEIVHLLGGTDEQIARIFQRSVAIDAALGGLIGLVLGGLAVLLIGQQFEGLDSGMIAGGTLSRIDWLVIAAIPLAGMLVALLTARITVMRALRRML